MSISSQLPSIPLAQAGEQLRSLAQMAGQTVDVRVVGQQANGLTQVAIGRQVLNLQLPTRFLPGTTLSLAVQQSDGQLRVTLVSTQPPAGNGPGAPLLASASPPAVPATNVQLSAAALSGSGSQQPVVTPPAGSAAVAPPVLPPGAGGQVASSPATQPQQAASPVPVAPIAVAAASAAGTSAAALARLPGRPVAQSAMPVAAMPPNQRSDGPVQALSGADGATTHGTNARAPADSNVALRPANPYAAASNDGGLTPAPAPTTGAVPGQAGAPGAGVQGQAISVATTGTSVPTGGVAGAPPTAATAQPVASAPASPQLALAQAVQSALPRQDSVVGLTTALAAAAGRVALPEPVAKAAQKILAQRLPLDGKLDGAMVQKALQNSGVFQEAMLAAGRSTATGGDLKTALMGLQRQLGAWLGNQAAVEQVGGVPPPVRGALPRARAGEAAMPDLPEDPVELGKVLAERTEAAISRLRLHQNASLPEPAAHRHEAQWSMDLPVMVGGQQALIHLQIHGDAEGAETEPGQRGWQVRFALRLEETGEVGSQISLRGKSTGVLLWAEEPETAAMLEEGKEALRADLGDVGLTAGAIVIRAGAPAPAVAGTATGAAAAGHIVDAVR